MTTETKYGILSIYFLILNITVLLPCSSVTKLEKNEQQINLDQNKSCLVPTASIDKNISFDCAGNPSKTCAPSNGYIQEFTVATVNCAAGYYYENEDRLEHFCRNGQWIPKITKCLKKCDQLNPVNVVLECNRGGFDIANCDRNSVLLAGTKVYPSCKSLYKYDRPPTYYEITCNNDGRWNNILLPCFPECGKPYTPAKTLISGGKPDKIGASPWHVAIYDKEKLLICGGTIISENIVIAAAHCFSEDNCTDRKCVDHNCEGVHCIDDFEVVVGKYTNNYTVTDNSHQRTMRIKEIRFPKSGYHGLTTYHTADIAVLILKDPIPISPAILPACVNWDDLKKEKTPSDGEFGKVAGWGRTENGTLSTILRSIELPFINSKQCLEIVDNDFRSFLTLDKFCAGTGNRTGASLMDGDSGGGLLFEDRGLFYLRGVVSVKQYSSNSVTIFTDLSKHVNWLISVHNDVDSNSRINLIQPSDDHDRNRTHQSVHNTNTYSNEEEAKSHLLPEIVSDIRSQRFSAAEQKLGLLQKDDGIFYYIVREVCNNQLVKFNLLLNFVNFIKNTECKFKIFEFLYNEAATSGHDNIKNLLLLMRSVKNLLIILDKLPEQNQSPLYNIYRKLRNSVISAGIGPITSAFLNDDSWLMVSQLSGDICAECYECTEKIYGLVFEAVCDKVTLDYFLSRVHYKLSGFVAEHIAAQLVVFDQLERTGALNASSAVKLVRYMNLVMKYTDYYTTKQSLRTRFEESKNKLLQYVNINNNGSNNVETTPRKEANRQLLVEIVDHINSHRFSNAEQILLQLDPSTYLNISNEVYDNQARNFNLLLDFGGYTRNTEGKIKIYQFLYNKTVNGLNDLQKLHLFMQFVKEEILSISTPNLVMLQIYQNSKNAFIKAAVGPIASAFLHNNSWSMVNEINSNVSTDFNDCIEKIYSLVVDTVWNKIPLEDLLSRVRDKITDAVEHIAVHLAVANKLEETGALNTSSAITLASYMNLTEQSTHYPDIKSNIRMRYEEARKKLLQSVKSNNSESNKVETKIQKESNHQLLAEIVDDIKSFRFTTAEQKLLQMDPSAYLNIVQDVYNNQTSNFDLLLSYGDFIADVECKFKIYEFLYETEESGPNDPQKLLRLSQSVKKQILNRSGGSLAAQDLRQKSMNATIKAAIGPISLAFQSDNSWPMVRKLRSDIENDCSYCMEMIYKSVVDIVWNKITLVDLLNRTNQNLKRIVDDVDMQLIVKDKLEHTGTFFTNSAITLARFMKPTMDKSEQNLNSKKRSQLQDVKNKLPQSVKNLVFSSAICIKNVQYNEYLYASTSLNDIYKSDEHRVYTRISGDKNEPSKFKWYVSFWSSHQIQLRDDRFSEYLYAGADTFDDSRRHVLTWKTNTPNENVAWDVEVDGNYIHITDNFYQEYLFADYNKKENETRRFVFTHRIDGRTLSSKWQIYDCS